MGDRDGIEEMEIASLVSEETNASTREKYSGILAGFSFEISRLD